MTRPTKVNFNVATLARAWGFSAIFYPYVTKFHRLATAVIVLSGESRVPVLHFRFVALG